MADLLDRDSIDAGLLLLRADAGLVVYPDAEGVVPLTPTPPYVRVYAHVERPAGVPSNALGGASTTAVVRWYCHCVGATEPASVAVAMRVRAALLDASPSITGRLAGMIRQEASQPPARDETTGTPVYDLVQVYVLTVC